MKLFDNMTPTEKIDHMEAMLAKALPEVKEVTCLADILDIWDYWMPYLIPRARRLEAVAEKVTLLRDNLRLVVADRAAKNAKVTDTRNIWQGQAYEDVLGVVNKALSALESE